MTQSPITTGPKSGAGDGQGPPARPLVDGEERGLRWRGPWAGAVVALPVFLVLQLLFLAFGWVGPDHAEITNGVVSAVLGVIALFVGGAACGATSRTHRAPVIALLEGAATWALTVVGILSLGLGGAASLLGSIGGATATLVAAPALTASALEGAQSTGGLQHAAGWAALWFGLAFIAALAGALATRAAGARAAGPATH